MTSETTNRESTASERIAAPAQASPPSAPARRRTQRLLIPELRLLVEGREHVAADWSLGGFQIETYVGALRAGDDFPIAAVGPVDGPLMPVGIRARALRRGEDTLAAQFIELDDRAFDALDALMRRRQRYLASLAATARAVA
jgi:hypothetical protein